MRTEHIEPEPLRSCRAASERPAHGGAGPLTRWRWRAAKRGRAARAFQGRVGGRAPAIVTAAALHTGCPQPLALTPSI